MLEDLVNGLLKEKYFAVESNDDKDNLRQLNQ